MGSTYGDAWINLLYDIDAEVKITNPSEEIMEVHGIKPKRYLVLPGTDKKFPEGVFIGVDNIHYRSKLIIEKTDNLGSQYGEKKDLDKCAAGETYPLTLIRRVVHVEPELESMGIPRFDAANELIFEPGNLERRLVLAKSEFLTMMEVCGLNAEESGIYFELVGCNPCF